MMYVKILILKILSELTSYNNKCLSQLTSEDSLSLTALNSAQE